MWISAPFSSASRLATGWAGLLLYLPAWPLWLASADTWPPAVPLAVAALALWQWWRQHRRYRFVADTPTGRCHSPVQGYGEYHGQARACGGQPLLTPYGQMRCVWYHASRQPRDDRHGHIRSRQHLVSDSAFLLADARGQLVIEPAGAVVETRHHHQWQDAQYHYRESWLADGDPLYALGSLVTLAGAPDRQAWRDDLQLLLNDWKADQAALLQRFDRDGNGALDADEWEAARQAAAHSIHRQHRELAATPPSHHLQKPADGRPFLLSWRTPAALAQRLRRLAWSHAAVAVLAGYWLTRLA